ncbi:MAG TPA: phosphonate C-P lyase system protein PhnH [Devosiaceae bacterium]|nr:phosphonate C-P lyase system protein PhnH [Devosiaceae bacterium]
MSAMSQAPKLLAGFADPVFDAQAVFRTLMSAIAYPGRVFTLEREVEVPAPLSLSATALCLTLADFETPVWLDGKAASPEALAHLRFHCDAPIVGNPEMARFALIADAEKMPRLIEFNQGVDQYPDRSTTLIIQVPSLTEGAEKTWTGPGIKGSIAPRIAGLPAWFWDEWALNRELYPTGVDVIFATGNAIVGMPRSIKVER